MPSDPAPPPGWWRTCAACGEISREPAERNGLIDMLRIDRYMLEKTMVPLGAAVGIALVALLMERMVRLMELLVNQGGPIWLVLKMLGNLVPHYLGLALPLALFLGALLCATRLSVDSEIDAMQSAGVGLSRLLWPVMGLALVITLVMFVLAGWLQPLTRYGYRALVYAATNSAWDLAVEKGSFFSGIGKSTILIDDISDNGRVLRRVFVYQDRDHGDISVLTAERGEAFRIPADLSVVLHLQNGRRVDIPAATERPKVLAFGAFDLPLEVESVAPFRDRFGERELTMPELLAAAQRPDLSPKVERSRLVSELHGRLVRPLSVLFMPILGMALGLAQRRNQRGAGLVVGVILLAIYNYTLTFGESGADKERLSPWLGLWTPMLVMFAFSIWAFWSVSSRPRDNLLTALFDTLERGVLGVAGQWRRLRGKPA
jgi:lipopolysaccharide export system permease protein